MSVRREREQQSRARSCYRHSRTGRTVFGSRSIGASASLFAMCGIVFEARWYRTDNHGEYTENDELTDRLRAVNSARGESPYIPHPLCANPTYAGPDAQSGHQTTLKTAHGGVVELNFFASELRLRGDLPVTQPHVNGSGDVLCWNGEVWSIHLSDCTCVCAHLYPIWKIFEGLDVCPYPLYSQNELFIVSEGSSR
jgi:hypothetical protein